MFHIVYYISGHGLGHLTRSLSIIELLLQYRSDISITIKCDDSHIAFTQHYLSDHNMAAQVQPYNSTFDIIVDPIKVCVDLPATITNLQNWLAKLPIRAQNEYKTIDTRTNLILSDIVPEAFLVAEMLGVPAIGISNFTWYEICSNYLPEECLTGLKRMYEKATVLLEFPLSTGNNMPVENRIPVGLICRPVNAERVKLIRDKFKRGKRPLLLFSIGGALELECQALHPGIDWLHTRGVCLPQNSNVFTIQEDDQDIQNYVAACDAVITKFGWSTLAEAIIAKKPVFLMQANGGWAEENLIMAEINTLGCIKTIRLADLYHFSPEVVQQQINEMTGHYKELSNRYSYSPKEIIEHIITYLPSIKLIPNM